MKTADDVRELLRARARKPGAKSRLAREAGVSRQFLTEVLAGRRDPSDKLARLLRLERMVVFVDARERHEEEQPA